VSPVSLTFTAENWNWDQRVTVNAGRDPDAAEDTAVLSHTIGSADPDYQDRSNASVDVTLSDPDRTGVTVGPLSPSPLYESGRRTEVVDEVVDGDGHSAGQKRIDE